MTDELKLCPFCGQPARFLESILNRGGVSCSNHECISWIRTTPEIWNARPVEDALRAENERLREVEDKALEQSEYIQTHGLTEYELALKDAEIKQLRAENDRLRAALEAVEYADMESRCPWCGNWYNKGHAPNCQRQAALGR